MAALLPPDLRKRIEVMAQHIAQNGPDFETTVMQKNVNNPQFAFLYEGEGTEYYKQVLASHRGGGAPAAAPQAAGAAEGLPPGVDLVAAVRRWREPAVYPLVKDLEGQLGELISALEQMASRDAIRNGRAWIEQNTAMASQIAGALMKRIVFLPTTSHRLHVLYLVHDVLQTEAARTDSQRPLIRAFKPYLCWILRPSYQLAQSGAAGSEDCSRVLRLLQLWVERGILAQQEAMEIKALVMAPELPSAPPPTPSAAPSRPPLAARPVGYQQQAVGGYPGMPGMAPGMVPGRPGMPGMVGMPGMMQPGAWRGPMGMHPTMYGQSPMMPGMVPGMGMPRPQGYRQMPPPGPGGRHTPETIPVGMLATMMVQHLERVGKANVPPYKPLDVLSTPQALPPMQVPAQRLMQRVEDFYQDLKDEDDSSSSSRSRSSSRSSRSRSRSRSPVRSAPGGFGAGSFGAVPPPVD